MRLYKRAEQDGALLFRWRSYLPLVIAPIALVALMEGELAEMWFGEAAAESYQALCALLSLGGLAIRWATVGWAADGTSGRNVHGQRAASLNTTGTYSVVRNPLYLGNFVAIMGIVMSTMVWWFVAIVALLYWLYIERIIAAEEAFLSEKFGTEYEAWAERTPAFLPRLSQWRRPGTPFRVRKVLRKEFYGVMAIASGFFAIEVVADLIVERESLAEWVREDWLEIALYLLVVGLFLIMLTLKKKTRLLH